MNRSNPVSRKLRRSLIFLALAAQFAGGAAWAADVTPELRRALASRVAFDAGAPAERFTGFIVYYQGDAAPGEDNTKAALDTARLLDADLDRVNARLSLQARQARRLATGGHLLSLPAGLDRDAADSFMAAMAANPALAFIEPDVIHHATAIPNDPGYAQQWGLREARGGLNIERAWNHSFGSGVVIAVVDTGRTLHPDLDAKTLPGYDFISDPARARDGNGRDADPSDRGTWGAAGVCDTDSPARDSSWHGTHVAGIAAALTDNGIGVAGAAPGAWLQHVRVLGACGSGTTSDIAEAVIWASGGHVAGVPDNATPARVINLSLGSYGGSCGNTWQRALDSARSRQSLVVVAAGNDDGPAEFATPANCANVLTVAANNRAGRRTDYSNYGLEVAVAAPGGEGSGDGSILSTLNDGTTTPGAPTYGSMNGTSMATPYVSGVAALVIERKPSRTAAQVDWIVRNTTRPFPSDCSGGCGTGIVDAAAAVTAARGGGYAGFPLSMALYGNGDGRVTSTPAGIDCGSACSVRFDVDRSVVLHAIPAEGFEFSRWYGDCRGTAPTCTVKMDKARVTFASFRIPIRNLANGSVRTGLSVEDGVKLMYALKVPAGATNLKFEISGGTGDADLYVRRDTEPSMDTYDCRPWKYGNNETCGISAPKAGTWYAMLNGDPYFSGLRLEASFTAGPLGGALLKRNVPLRNIAIPEGGARYYRFQVPSSVVDLRFETVGGSGDLDLYVRRGAIPTTSTYLCASGRSGNGETCEIDAPASGTYYVMLDGYSAVSGATITANYAAAKALTIKWSGTGAGSVKARRITTGETKANCTVLPCKVNLGSGVTFDLIATAASGSRFAGWRAGGCDSITAAGNCRVKMGSARSATGQFTLEVAQSPVLTVNRSGSGNGVVRVSRVATGAASGTCTDYPCRMAVSAKGQYLLSAAPGSGSTFDGWLAGQCDSVTADGGCRVTLDRPRIATVKFAPR